MITGRITLILRPEIQLARNVFIPWLNLIGYIAVIDHSIQWGRMATTTLSLKYIRHPWEPWYPLEYMSREEQDRIDNAPRDTVVGNIYPTTRYSRVSSGKHAPGQSDSSERELGGAATDANMVSVQQHEITGSALDAFSRAVAKLQKPLVGDEPIKLTILRTTEGPFTSDRDPHKYGLAIDAKVSLMEGTISTSPGYKKKKKYLEKVGNVFRGEGFIVRNMYDIALNPALKGDALGRFKGYLELTYARVPDRLKGYDSQ